MTVPRLNLTATQLLPVVALTASASATAIIIISGAGQSPQSPATNAGANACDLDRTHAPHMSCALMRLLRHGQGVGIAQMLIGLFAIKIIIYV